MQFPTLAKSTFRRIHALYTGAIVCALAALVWFYGMRITAIAFITFISVLYFLDLLFSLRLVLSSIKNPEQYRASQDELTRERQWPSYTVFCPLYKEEKILPQFVKAMKALDYPKSKLHIMLLLEEDDVDTIVAAKKMQLPSYFTITVVPHSTPKTKPKACNYGLMLAGSEYAVIFDAEDIPEPDQIKKAVVSFEKAPGDVACLQAKLNFYNPAQNILTRLFTAEYSLWFDLILVGLQNLKGPVPLGGTSNHFRSEVLKGMQGWDPYNVTEDCDLGVRLYKQGFRTGMLDSYTFEEANSRFKNWLRQRSRWVKGYMQTYLVHTGQGRGVKRHKADLHVFTFHLLVGGKVFTLLINPLMIALTLTYFIARSTAGPAIESLYPAPVFYIALVTLLAGNFLYLYYYMLGCMSNKQWSLVKYVVFVPVYWLMMSLAGAYALYQLIIKPHYWEKTTHGLHLPDQAPEQA